LQPIAEEVFPASHPNPATDKARKMQGRVKGITKLFSRIMFLLSIAPAKCFLRQGKRLVNNPTGGEMRIHKSKDRLTPVLNGSTKRSF
jgi:hypothetical protein